MNIIRSRRARIAALTVGLASTVAIAAASTTVGTASAQGLQCKYIFNSLEALDLQESVSGSNPGDEMYLTLDGSRFPQSVDFVRYDELEARSANSWEFPQAVITGSTLKIRLWEADTGFDEQIDSTLKLPCTGAQPDQAADFVEPGSASYRMVYDVVLV